MGYLLVLLPGDAKKEKKEGKDGGPAVDGRVVDWDEDEEQKPKGLGRIVRDTGSVPVRDNFGPERQSRLHGPGTSCRLPAPCMSNFSLASWVRPCRTLSIRHRRIYASPALVAIMTTVIPSQ